MHGRTLRPFVARVAVVAALGATYASVTTAQAPGAQNPQSLGIVPGARARLVVSEYGTTGQVGTIEGVRDDGFVFRREAGADSVIVAYGHVAKLELSRGRHARTLTGLGVGLFGGAAIGAIALYATTPKKPSCPSYAFGCGIGYLGPGGQAAAGAAIGGLAGGVLGTVIGSVIHTERWRTVSVDGLVLHAQARLSVLPSSGPRLALGMSARF